jgi:Beta-propeller domains of methanol dehydrogenase type
MRLLTATALLLVFIGQCAFAQIQFPPLTGRVVDNADLLDARTERELTELLAAHEQATTNQVVVVTLSNLQGQVIEDFGYQLGRAWGIGQKDKDNGVILLVAQEERRVRIEVGYGLEGTLTDAISANIIHSIILPKFKQAQFNDGIREGTLAIIAALGDEYAMREVPKKDKRLPLFMIFLLIVAIFLLATVSGGTGGGYRRGGYYGGLGGFGGGGFGGGGFGGGGGGFGGGGASGGW